MPLHHHDQQHGGACCGNHGDQLAESYSLFEKIDLMNVECLNERVDGSGAKVFKAWSERLSREQLVESDCDAEMIFNIPFTGDVKLTGVVVIADETLAKMRLFKSKMRMSFDDVQLDADQEFDVIHDPNGCVEYPVKPAKFSNVHHLTIHLFNHNKEEDAQPCRVYYIGLKGDFTQVNRDGIVIANYEVRPTENVADELSRGSREIQ